MVSFNISWIVGLLVMKGIFTEYRILCWLFIFFFNFTILYLFCHQHGINMGNTCIPVADSCWYMTFLFSFQHAEDVTSLSSCLQVFWQEVCWDYVCSSVYMCLFLWLPSRFSLRLLFVAVWLLYAQMLCLFLYLPCLVFSELLGTEVWCLSLIFGNFFLQFKLSLNCFALFSFTSPSGIQITCMLDYLLCSVPWVFC